jgi:hypothetical protein
MSKESLSSYPNNKQENWIAYRESEEFRTGVKLLEEAKGIAPTSKALIMSVALNLKQAAEFESSDRSQDEIEKMLSKLGVYFLRDEEWEEFSQAPIPVLSYLIATTPDVLNKAINNTRPTFDEHYGRNFGEAMEFPATSIDAWEYGEELLAPTDPRLTSEEKAFLFFRLSASDWEKEVEWLEQLIAGVKQYSPQIYNQVMTRRQS